MPDLGNAYLDARDRMISMVRDLDDDRLNASVPACPDWSVRDLIAHVSSIATDLAEGRLPEDLNLVMVWDPDITRRREEWIVNALAQRSGMTIGELIQEWTVHSDKLASMLRGEQPLPDGAPPLVEWIVVTDVGVHLQDLAGALNVDEHRDALATGLALRSYVEGMKLVSATKGLPALRIRAGSREWVVGNGEPAATVTEDPWELSRAASGRRSPDQIRAYRWDGDPEPFLELFYPYGVRPEPLAEAQRA